MRKAWNAASKRSLKCMCQACFKVWQNYTFMHNFDTSDLGDLFEQHYKAWKVASLQASYAFHMFCLSSSEIRKLVRRDKIQAVNKLAVQAQEAADKKDAKSLHRHVRILAGKSGQGFPSLFLSDGSIA